MADDVSDFIVSISEKHPYYDHLGIEVKEAKDGKSRLEVEVKSELLQLFGTVHGGVFASLIDAAAGIAIYSELFKKDKAAVTQEFKINYYKPMSSGKIIAEGEVEHLGKGTATSNVKILNQEGELVAKGTATFYVLDDESSEKMLQKARSVLEEENQETR